MFIYYCYYGLTIYIMYFIEYPWDGSTSWIFLVIIYFISPLRGVAETPDCGISLISPLCGVAQMPDCGISFKALYVASLRRPTVALLDYLFHKFLYYHVIAIL